jgi:uncharacterized Zn finger protein
MPRENAFVKARRLLGEGRLVVHHVVHDDSVIQATCRGDSGEIYSVGHEPGRWYCDCPSLGRCSHVQALMLVTVRRSER